MPAASSERARARLWIDFADSRLFAPTHRFIFERDEKQRSVLIEQMQDGVRLLDQALQLRAGKETYLMGSQFTLADIAIYPWFEQLATFQNVSGFRMPEGCHQISDWSASVAARPAVKQCSQTNDWYEVSYRRYLAA